VLILQGFVSIYGAWVMCLISHKSRACRAPNPGVVDNYRKPVDNPIPMWATLPICQVDTPLPSLLILLNNPHALLTQ
jgi:hypothetical protein